MTFLAHHTIASPFLQRFGGKRADQSSSIARALSAPVWHLTVAKLVEQFERYKLLLLLILYSTPPSYPVIVKVLQILQENNMHRDDVQRRLERQILRQNEPLKHFLCRVYVDLINWHFQALCCLVSGGAILIIESLSSKSFFEHLTQYLLMLCNRFEDRWYVPVYRLLYLLLSRVAVSVLCYHITVYMGTLLLIWVSYLARPSARGVTRRAGFWILLLATVGIPPICVFVLTQCLFLWVKSSQWQQKACINVVTIATVILGLYYQLDMYFTIDDSRPERE